MQLLSLVKAQLKSENYGNNNYNSEIKKNAAYIPNAYSSRKFSVYLASVGYQRSLFLFMKCNLEGTKPNRKAFGYYQILAAT